MAKKLTHAQMIEKLERITFDEQKDRAEVLNQISMADSLLMVANLSHEREYLMCREIALHVLGEVPEPDDIDLGDLDEAGGSDNE